KPVEDGFRQIGPGVTRRDPVETQSATEALGCGITSVPRGGLDVARPELRPFDLDFGPQHPCELEADLLIAVGVGTQPVVEMEQQYGPDPKQPDEPPRERSGVPTAGDEGHPS